MGFFSQDCQACGESVKAPYDLPGEIAWHNKAVAITPSESIIKGPYDGYGNIDYDGMSYMDDSRMDIGGENTVYHQRCWEKLGSPTKYDGKSEDSKDQGFFYNYP
jgi:hypothetical protein